MKEMKDSGIEWIGEIPRQWKIIKLCYITSMMFLGKTPIYSTEKNENLTLGQKNNQLYGLDLEGIKYSTNEHFLSCKESEYLQFGDILLNSLGTGSVGRIGYFNVSDKKMITDGHIIVIRPNDKVNNKYLFYYLTTLRKKLEDDAVGSTNQAFLTVPKIYKIEIPFPSLSEQKAIADFLDKQCAEIDSVIEQTKATIEEYKKLKQSVITEAVTKGIRGDRPLKDSGVEWIGDIPADWSISRIKYVSDFEPSTDKNGLDEESIITYTPMDCIKNGWFINQTAPLGSVSTSLTAYRDGDIVMAKVTPCFENGNIAIMENLSSGYGLGSSELFVLRAKNIVTKYLFYWLRNDKFVQSACSTMTGTGGLKRVSPTFVKDCYLHLPRIEEQAEIAEYLDNKCAEIDTIIEKKTLLLEEMETYKKSVIYEYVTGKKEVC